MVACDVDNLQLVGHVKMAEDVFAHLVSGRPEHVERLDLIWLHMAAVVLAAESAHKPRVWPRQLSSRGTPALCLDLPLNF